MEELECDIFAIVKKPVPKVEEKKVRIFYYLFLQTFGTGGGQKAYLCTKRVPNVIV